ncbi:hypothetical protein KCU81_g814, partial [Aureobasidium melanogenum]
MYLPTSLLGSILVLLIFLSKNERKGLTPERRKVERLRLGFGLLCASLDDLDKVALDILEGHGLHQCLDVDLLYLEVIEDIGKAVKRTEVTSSNVLHVGDVVVDNFQEP